MHISHARNDVPAAISRAEEIRPQTALNLTSLWEHVVLTKCLPPNTNVQLLYSEITRRLCDPEWEVRQNSLRVLADVLEVSPNDSLFPIKEVVDNLGHSAPTVRKAALDVLKVFVLCTQHSSDAILYLNSRCNCDRAMLQSNDIQNNIITGSILSIPSILLILKRSNRLDNYVTVTILKTLSWKMFDVLHSDVAFKALVKLKKILGAKHFYDTLIFIDNKLLDKFSFMCQLYNVDESVFLYHPSSSDAALSSSGNSFGTTDSDQVDFKLTDLHSADNSSSTKSDESSDSDKGILTVLDGTNIITHNEFFERNLLRQNTDESDLITPYQKRVTFGGEVVKVRTPDSENVSSNEEKGELIRNKIESGAIIKIHENQSKPIQNSRNKPEKKRSGIPLPVINIKQKVKESTKMTKTISDSKRVQSKSLSELYNHYRQNTDNMVTPDTLKSGSNRRTSLLAPPPDPIPSPVEPHREIEVFHNLQRSPDPSPPRTRKVISIEEITDDNDSLCPLASQTSNAPQSPENIVGNNKTLQSSYEWEKLNVIGKDVVNQLHNTQNWIGLVRALDKLQRNLADQDTVKALESSGTSLIQQMWTLSELIPPSRAPAESVVCTLLRGASSSAVRSMLPAVLPRLFVDPASTAVSNALLSQFSLPELVRIILDWVPEQPDIMGSTDEERLKALVSVAQVAGPAALLAAVRRTLPQSKTADDFWNSLRIMLRRPVENWTPAKRSRSNGVSKLPILSRSIERRRARSTPPPTARRFTVRVRTLADSAPPGGFYQSSSADNLLPLVATNHCSQRNENFSSTPIKHQTESQIDTPHSPAVSVHVDFKNIEQDFTVVITNQIRTPSRSCNSSTEEKVESPVKVLELDSDSHKSSVGNISISEISQHSRVSTASDKTGNNILVVTPHDSPIKVSPKNSKLQSIDIEDVDHSDDEEPQIIQRKTPLPHRTPSHGKDVSSELNSFSSLPPRHEDWEVIMTGLAKVEKLARDNNVSAPVGVWRSVTRSVSAHVRSPRSRVARAACKTLAALFSHRGKEIEPESEDAAAALLDRTADVNKFLRADAAEALSEFASGISFVKAATILAKRGATHKAALVRAATAKILSELAAQDGGTSKLLKGQIDTRSLILKVAADLIEDASPEARSHARKLMTALAEEPSFHVWLKDSVTPSKYKSIERNVDMLRMR